MLTNEELTYPRFKVLVDYPGAQFHVGQVLLFNHKEDWFTGKPEWTLVPTITRQGGKSQIYIGSIEPFTEVFKRLEWFEERTQDQMPRYIKYKDNGSSYIEKLLAHNPDIETDKLPHFGTKRLEHGLHYHNTSAEPATRHEWLKFIQKNNPHLIPRYIVQLEYPDSPYPLNKVLTNPTGKELKLVLGFPKIFRKLMWYEMRTQSQLPKYLRNSSSGVIYKASYPTTETVQLEDIFGNTALAKFTNLEPASVEELDDYKENKTQTKTTPSNTGTIHLL